MNWPNESEQYRSARDELLQAEIELRRQEEAVAAQRRALPLGGEVTGDYVFDSPSGPVRFAELYANGKDTLYLYNFMFIPGEQGLPLEVACPSCTSIIDGTDGAFRHLLDRVDVAIVAKAPIAQFAAWGKERGWRFAPLYSSSPQTRSVSAPSTTSTLSRSIPANGLNAEPVPARQFEQWQLPAYRNASATR